MKNRLVVLTDIYDEKRFITEVDDIESMVRLILYSNEIDIEGLIPCTSFCYRKGVSQKNVDVILRIIDAYEQIKPNLDVHAEGYPEPEYLRSVTCAGIPVYGKGPGKGFAEEKWNDNPGVNRIIAAVDKQDNRPLWISLWGGANTLAQAIWKIWKTRSETDLNIFLSKLRIYGISDQDLGSRWIREMFGDRLFYIVSPSPGTIMGTKSFKYASWPGMAGDNFNHGSEDGKKGGGFKGARADLFTKGWLTKNIQSHGVYGARYPLPHFIMEGDTPSYLSLIQNGLNVPDRPDYGGWGGRYKFYTPHISQFNVVEKYPIWTNSSDTVIGSDGKEHTSPQATIWRWREGVQNDFAARMDWTMTNDYSAANHPPIVKINHDNILNIRSGEYVNLNAERSFDPDGDTLTFHWFNYKEAGNYDGDIKIDNNTDTKAGFTAPVIPAGKNNITLHIILEVKDSGTPALIRYQRIVATVIPEGR